MNKPAPGFIANRLQHALYREAVYMVEQGICGPEDHDKCIRSSWGPGTTLHRPDRPLRLRGPGPDLQHRDIPLSGPVQ